MKLFYSIILSLFWLGLSAQNALIEEEERERFNFAQTYFGGSLQVMPAAQLQMPEGVSHSLSDALQPRFLIGGTHFWGIMDFYISFPLSSPIKLNQNNSGFEGDISTGVMTGARWFPTRMSTSRLDPFAGLSWSFFNTSLQIPGVETAPSLTSHRVAFEAGLSYTTEKWDIFELFASYTPNSKMDYYLNRSEVAQIQWPGFSYGFSYKKMFDFTQAHEPIKDLDSKKHLNAWHLGIGPSTTQALVSSDFVSKNTPWLNNPARWQIFPELSLGYYFHQPDFDLRLSYRPMRQNQEGHGVEHTISRHSLALESFFYLMDYQGFVPFVGLSLAGEHIRFRQKGSAIENIDHREQKFFPGLVFGWDIRPTRYKTWLLRTNLRYYPTAEFSAGGESFSLQQLEFNFIQLVVFPERLFE